MRGMYEDEETTLLRFEGTTLMSVTYLNKHALCITGLSLILQKNALHIERV